MPRFRIRIGSSLPSVLEYGELFIKNNVLYAGEGEGVAPIAVTNSSNSTKNILLSVGTSNVSSSTTIPSGSIITSVATIINTGYTSDVAQPILPFFNSESNEGFNITSDGIVMNPDYYAFNGDTNGGDAASGCYSYPNSNSSVTVQCPKAYTVTGYTIGALSSPSGPFQAPSSWNLQGSNDGLNWTVLDSQSYQNTWYRSTVKSFTVASPDSYTYYKFSLTGNNGNLYVGYSNLQLFAVVGDGDPTLDVVVNGSTPLTIQGNSQNTPKIVGVNETRPFIEVSSANSGVVEVVVGNNPVSGSAKVLIEYIDTFLS